MIFRGMAGRLGRMVMSRATLFWLIAAWVLLYVTLAIWTGEAFGKYMERLPGNSLMQLPLVIFIVVAAVNCIEYASRKIRASWLSAPLWLMGPTGLLLFLIGFFGSAMFSDSGRIFVGKGSIVEPPWQERTYEVSEVEPGLPEEMTDMSGSGAGLVFRHSPRLYLQEGRVRHEVGVFPPTRAGNTYYHIMDFGLAPGVRISRDGNVLKEGYVIQKILPPGVRDSFEIKPFPYRFAIKMLPVRELAKGQDRIGLYSLRRPVYSVVVEKGQEIVFEGKSSGPIQVDGLDADFYGPDYWFLLEGSRNPFYIILAAGMALGAVGIPLLIAAMLYGLLRSLIQTSHLRKH